jgi:Ca2+-transporting ATPase
VVKAQIEQGCRHDTNEYPLNGARKSSESPEWHAMEPTEAFVALNSSGQRGLSEGEAASRLSVRGPNEIQKVKKEASWKLLLDQFKETLILILIAAALVSILIGEAIDSAVILVIVFASAGLGFYQEYRAEQSLALLKKLAAPSATVIREGLEKVVPARELVPGDLIILDPGDKVPADARIVDQMNLRIDEAVLTGESVPVEKSVELVEPETPLQERINIAFSGTVVTYGRGRAVVFATGMETEFGKIARLIQTDELTQTPLEKRMDELGNWMIKVLLVTVVLISVLGILRGHALLEMFLWGVSLAVAAVPEALPAVVTGALAIGVYRMARRKAIVRHLPATETLGSTTVICSDKTGTLTKGEMTVKRVYAQGNVYEVTGVGYEPRGEFNPPLTDLKQDPVRFTCLCGALCNDAKLTDQTGSWKVIGDPTEGALIVAAAKAHINVDAARQDYPRVAEVPFTSERKIMTTVHKTKNSQYLLASKGAVEVVIRKCGRLQHETSSEILDQGSRQRILRANDNLASEGFRVLAVGYRLLGRMPGDLDEGIEQDMTFLGLVGMIDPPREEATEAVKLCEKAGVRVVMITGDHKLTAAWVAKELGIMKKDDMALTGAELDRLSDAEFANIVDRVSVYSRTSPEHKTRIVEALKSKGNVVAMTGDGINDAPALKKSDIGVAMGITGTDVTKDASDMILADDNFATIVAAVYEGRGIFENIRKYLTYLLSANIGEILVMAVAGLIALPLPLLAKHLLFVNLATDGLPALALGTDPPDPLLMEKPPRDPDESIFATVHRWLAGIAILLLAAASVAFLYALVSYGWTFSNHVALAELKARSMVFATIIFFEIFFAFSCRSFSRTFFSTGPLGNKPLIAVVLGQALLMPFIFQVPILANLFSVTALNLEEWLIVAGLGSLGFILSELAKSVSGEKRSSGFQKPDGSVTEAT